MDKNIIITRYTPIEIHGNFKEGDVERIELARQDYERDIICLRKQYADQLEQAILDRQKKFIAFVESLTNG